MITARAIPIATVTPKRNARITMRPVHAIRSEYRSGSVVVPEALAERSVPWELALKVLEVVMGTETARENEHIIPGDGQLRNPSSTT
jgi:hypothetical protein